MVELFLRVSVLLCVNTHEHFYNHIEILQEKAQNEVKTAVVMDIHGMFVQIVLLNQLVCWQVHRLVVVDQHSNIQGIVSLSDILQALVLSPAGTPPPRSVPDRVAWRVWFMWAGCC